MKFWQWYEIWIVHFRTSVYQQLFDATLLFWLIVCPFAAFSTAITKRFWHTIHLFKSWNVFFSRIKMQSLQFLQWLQTNPQFTLLYGRSHYKQRFFCVTHFSAILFTHLKDSTVPKKITVHVRLSLNAKCKQGQPLIKHGISNFVAFLFSKVTKFFSCDFFDQRKTTFFCRLSFASWKLKLLLRLDKGKGQERKSYNSLTWSKLHFRGATLPSKPEVWRVFWPLRYFKVRAEPNKMVGGPVAIFTLGTLWHISWHDCL